MGKAILGVLAVLLVIVLILGGWVAGKYNGLVASRNAVDGKWAQVENNLQRRADLIPNLVNAVKGYVKLEESVFTKIAEARAKIQSTTATPEEKMDASNQMTAVARKAGLIPGGGGGGGGILGTGGRFLSIVEQYPQLKSDTQFLKLQDELAGTENRLAIARKDYNEAVQAYNTTRQTFPTVMIAGMLNFQDKPFFKAEEGAKTVPKVDFSK
ncbi:MAG: LemA family protein [Acidobacteria bacterium]|nr:LemA family protein [Acidobacteriota bacterium]MBI3426860.1 LemA family protein [Acidobacteriota bacterium]